MNADKSWQNGEVKIKYMNTSTYVKLFTWNILPGGGGVSDYFEAGAGKGRFYLSTLSIFSETSGIDRLIWAQDAVIALQLIPNDKDIDNLSYNSCNID